jgi:hypothetical protein
VLSGSVADVCKEASAITWSDRLVPVIINNMCEQEPKAAFWENNQS